MSAELCPNCGREWPARFGSHNCNYHRAYLHNNALVSNPGEKLHDAVDRLCVRLQIEACRSAESYDLAGEPSPYPHYLADIDRTIGQLKQFRAGMQRLSTHVHKWDSDDYCTVCHADGRA